MRKIWSILLAILMVFLVRGIPRLSAQNDLSAAAVERGKNAFGANCGFCHGAQANGTEQAPSLVRSPLVYRDVNGNVLTPIIKAGRPTLGMPSFASLPPEQIANIIAFLHARAAEARGRGVPETALLVGDAKAGDAFFNHGGGCTACHSSNGDLAHIGTKYSPLNLTMAFLTPVPKPLQAKVTLPSGKTVSGTVDYMDEFSVSLIDSSGEHHTWPREALRSVIVVDPLAAHEELLGKYSDADIHNLLAYLVTLK